jgi:hypothetical protein
VAEARAQPYRLLTAIESAAPADRAPPSATLLTACVLGGSLVVGLGTGLGIVPGVAALAAVAFGLVVLDRPVRGGLVLIAVVPILPGLRRGLPLPGLRLSEALIVGIAAIVLVRGDRDGAPPWGAFDWLAVAYAALTAVIGTVDVMARGDHLTVDNVNLLVGPAQFLLLYRAVAVSVRRHHARVLALRGVFLASIPVSLLAILQQLDVGGIRETMRSLTGSEVFTSYGYELLPRATGPFPHWHLLAGYLVVVLLLGVALVFHRAWLDVLPTWVLATVLVLAAVALVLSVTITAMFGVVAGSLLLGLATGHVGKLLVWAGCAALVMNVAFGSVVTTRLSMQFPSTPGAASHSVVPQTIAYRFQVWKDQFLPAVAGRWVTGFGPDLPPNIQWRHTESLYLTLILRGGLPLLAVYLALMWALVATARRRTSAGAPELTAIARAVIALVIVLVPMHAVFPYFTASGMPHLLWALAGLLAGAEDVPERA